MRLEDSGQFLFDVCLGMFCEHIPLCRFVLRNGEEFEMFVLSTNYLLSFIIIIFFNGLVFFRCPFFFYSYL